MNLQKHIKIFNTIAPAYNLFFNRQYSVFCEILEEHRGRLSIPGGGSVLDLGCGTGALLQAFIKNGYKVQGVDLADAMLKKAKQRGLKCKKADVLKGLAFEDNSFDLVSASFVVHGLDREKRLIFFNEAKRISRDKVLFHDYSSRRNLIINIIEYMEGGDYFNFIHDGLNDMKEVFTDVELLEVHKYHNWYICTV